MTHSVPTAFITNAVGTEWVTPGLPRMIFVGILQVLKFEFLNFRIWEILNFHPWACHVVIPYFCLLQEQNGRVLDKWTIANREEEHIIIQQFLRFGETKSIAQEIIVQETRERQDIYIKQTSRNESEIKKFIERSNFPMPGFMRPFDPRHLFGNRLPFVAAGNRLLSPPLPGFSPPTSRDLRPPVITVGSTSPGTTSPLGRLQTMQPFDFRHEASSPNISPGQIVSEKNAIGDHSPRSESPQNLSITSTSSPSTPPPFTPQKNTNGESPMGNISSTASLSLSAPAMLVPMMPHPDDDARILNFSVKDEVHHRHSSIFADKKVKHLRKSSNPIKRQWLPSNAFGTTMIGPNGKKRVLCTACNKTFCDKGALKIHYSAVHLKEMHKCSVEGCTMMFSSRRSRNRHSANPNPKLHMPQKRPKMPDGVTIIDDGSGSTPTRPLSSPPPTMIHPSMATHSPVNMMESPERRPFYSDPNLQLPMFPSVAKRIKLDFDDYEDGPKDLSLPLIRREQENYQFDTPVKESPDSSCSDSERQDSNSTALKANRRKNIPSRCAQPSDMFMVSDDNSDDKDPMGRGQNHNGSPVKKLDQNGCYSPSTNEDTSKDQQSNDDDKGKKCDSSSDKTGEHITEHSDHDRAAPFERESFVSDAVSDGALDFSKTVHAEHDENLSMSSEQDNSLASNESDYAKSNGDFPVDFEIPLDKDDPRKCAACGKSFLNHFTLKIHYKNVHLKLLHNCTVEGCNASFPSKRSRDRHAANLNLHRKLLSTSDKLDADDNQNFRADIIQKLYESHSVASDHVDAVQENTVNGHTNDEVSKEMSEDNDYDNDMVGSLSIDEGEIMDSVDPVTCHICEVKFRDNLILKEHYEIHHPRETFPCTITGCEKTFSTRKSRNHHSQNDNLHRNMSPNRRTVVV